MVCRSTDKVKMYFNGKAEEIHKIRLLCLMRNLLLISISTSDLALRRLNPLSIAQYHFEEALKRSVGSHDVWSSNSGDKA